MKKGIIFFGPAQSGKSKKAAEISSSFKSVVWINCRNKSRLETDPFIFSECTEETELIVFDDVLPVVNFDFFLLLIGPSNSSGVIVQKKGIEDFMIKPQILIICESNSLFISARASYSLRFDFYKFPYCGVIEFRYIYQNMKSEPVFISSSNHPLPSEKKLTLKTKFWNFVDKHHALQFLIGFISGITIATIILQIIISSLMNQIDSLINAMP